MKTFRIIVCCLQALASMVVIAVAIMFGAVWLNHLNSRPNGLGPVAGPAPTDFHSRMLANNWLRSAADGRWYFGPELKVWGCTAKGPPDNASFVDCHKPVITQFSLPDQP